ncbi:MAG: hypothetical protein ABSF99_03465 [Anaerolineales bacterium]|jgi:hypothetical protein
MRDLYEYLRTPIPALSRPGHLYLRYPGLAARAGWRRQDGAVVAHAFPAITPQDSLVR